MKRHTLLYCFMLLSLPCLSQEPRKSEIVELNGKKIYYEIYGKGSPLFLLHGYSISSKSWKPFIKDFQENYSVYLVDLYGHGKSESYDKDWSVEEAGRSFYDLVSYLGLMQIYGIGYSYGGDVLFQLATLDKSLVKSFITIGSVGSWNANDFPDWISFFSMDNIDNLGWLNDHQQNDKQIKAMLDHFSNYNVKLSEEQLRDISSNVLLLLGDDDASIDLREVMRVRNNLPNSDLCIMPNSPHGAHEMNHEEFVRVSSQFFQEN